MSFAIPEGHRFNITLDPPRTAGEEISHLLRIDDILRSIDHRVYNSNDQYYVIRLGILISRADFERISVHCSSIGLRAELTHNEGIGGSYQSLQLTRIGIPITPSEIPRLVQPKVSDVEAKLGIPQDMWDTLSAQELVNAVFEVIRTQTEMNYSVRTPPRDYYVRTPSPQEYVQEIPVGDPFEIAS